MRDLRKAMLNAGGRWRQPRLQTSSRASELRPSTTTRVCGSDFARHAHRCLMAGSHWLCMLSLGKTLQGSGAHRMSVGDCQGDTPTTHVGKLESKRWGCCGCAEHRIERLQACLVTHSGVVIKASRRIQKSSAHSLCMNLAPIHIHGQDQATLTRQMQFKIMRCHSSSTYRQLPVGCVDLLHSCTCMLTDARTVCQVHHSNLVECDIQRKF